MHDRGRRSVGERRPSSGVKRAPLLSLIGRVNFGPRFPTKSGIQERRTAVCPTRPEQCLATDSARHGASILAWDSHPEATHGPS